MITIVAAVAILAAVDIPVAKVADDAKAIDRVAQASKRDLPTDLLRRIVNEDIEQLRGHRADGTYEYAGFDRFESGRTSKSFSVDSSDHTLEVHGSFVYRLQIDSPSRRMLVTRNRKVYLDHVDIDYIPVTPGAARKTQTVKIEEWIDAGQQRSVDFEAIAKEATVRLFAHSDKATGYGNLDLSLIEARVIDNADSPYADAVASAKAIQRALDHNDISSIRAMAQRMYSDLQPGVGPAAAGEVTVRPAEAGPHTDMDLLNELQAIEDLLTGSEAERRQGMDRLHQLVRKLRPQTH
ncbi:MAG TPA: hypothetical protein VJ853_10355 [Thermoanaerobaculia bacterium]|nr:hypothetical protein [Thermoanaerobaculia bacterium]